MTSAKARRKRRRTKAVRSAAAPDRDPRRGPTWRRLDEPWIKAVLIVLWTVVVHGAFIASTVLASTPVSLFLFGDSPVYFEEARRLALGLEPLHGGLPYHPPLTAWLLVPLWWIFKAAGGAYLAAKLLMAALSGVTYGLFYRLIRGRVPAALLICLLMPLSFGEIALASAVSNEVPYRLLLLLIVLLGFRRPVVAGILHGAAALTRAEHLPLAVLLLAIGLARPKWRRFAALAAAGGAIVLVPHLLFTARAIANYNHRYAAELPAPLPVVVPVSYYGPLNFALAQREAGIFFSRRSLPPPPGELQALDPTFAPHNDLIVHGYARGLATILEAPGRFALRTAARIGHSLRAIGLGWTWRALPLGSWGDPDLEVTWVRQPVDIAYAEGPWPVTSGQLGLSLAMIILGAWTLRGERIFLSVGFALLAYRLAVNAAFFPYLRGLLVVSPFLVSLFFAGVGALLGRFTGRALAALLVLLGLYHLATVGGDHRILLAGERTPDGRIIDDRRVEIKLAATDGGR